MWVSPLPQMLLSNPYLQMSGVGEQGCCTSGNKMSLFATALRKVEIRLAKNVTPYFYQYSVIVPGK